RCERRRRASSRAITSHAIARRASPVHNRSPLLRFALRCREPARPEVSVNLTACLALVAACGDNLGGNTFGWDDHRKLCSAPIDDLTGKVDITHLDGDMGDAAASDRALILHAHQPGVTVSRDLVDRVLAAADAHGMGTVTFRDLVPAPS